MEHENKMQLSLTAAPKIKNLDINQTNAHKISVSTMKL